MDDTKIPLMKDEKGNLIYMDIPKTLPKIVMINPYRRGMSMMTKMMANKLRHKVFWINDTKDLLR